MIHLITHIDTSWRSFYCRKKVLTLTLFFLKFHVFYARLKYLDLHIPGTLKTFCHSCYPLLRNGTTITNICYHPGDPFSFYDKSEEESEQESEEER